MALQMLCSHWLVCGWMLSLLVGAGVAIYQRYANPERFQSLRWAFPALQEVKWDAGWVCYAELRGRMEDDRVQIGRSNQRGGADAWQEEGGPGWRYA